MQHKFHRQHSTIRSYDLPPEADLFDKFPNGIYKVHASETTYGLNISYEEQSKFSLPSKIYGSLLKRYARVVNAYKNADKSLGVLMCGISGTGKSLLAKYICNNITDVPVLIIDRHAINYLESIIKDVNTPAVYFIDEFEKMFNAKDEQNYLLSIMDGTLTGDLNKNLFLLTANEADRVNNYMINRPSRIRYFYEYTEVESVVIEGIINENFETEKAQEVLSALSRIHNLSFDIIKEFIEECKLFPEIEPKELLDDFNVIYFKPDLKDYTYKTFVGDKPLDEFIGLKGLSFDFYAHKRLDDILKDLARNTLSDDPFRFTYTYIGKENDKVTYSNDYCYFKSNISNISLSKDSIKFTIKLDKYAVQRILNDLGNMLPDKQFNAVKAKLKELVNKDITAVGEKFAYKGLY